jgi:hypothetical protein
MDIVILDEGWFSPCRLIQTFCDENFIQMAAHPPIHRIWHPWTFGSSGISRGSGSGSHSKQEKNFSMQFNRFQSGNIAIGFPDWMTRFQRCIQLKGDYIEQSLTWSGY